MKEKIFIQSEITDMANLVHESLEGRYSLTSEELYDIEAMLVELQELSYSLCFEEAKPAKSAEEFVVNWMFDHSIQSRTEFSFAELVDCAEQYDSSQPNESEAVKLLRKIKDESMCSVVADEWIYQFLKGQPKQSMPSDKEIIDYVSDIFLDDINEGENNLYINGVIDGAKWMRNKFNKSQSDIPQP